MLLGLFITLASIPGYTSVSIPAGWAVMSIALPIVLWRGARLTPLHWLFLAFLAYVALSLVWTTNPTEGGFRLWQLILIFGAFCYGSSVDDLRSVILGLAIGGAINSAIAIIQHFGIQPVLFFSTSESSGLYYNSVWLGAISALTAIACLTHGHGPWALAMLPGIYLSNSRGAWLTLVVGFILICIPRPKLLLALIAICLFIVTISTSPHDAERMMFWYASAINLTPFGNGAGSFYDLWIVINGALRHPDSAHNDLLQLVFEFGLGAAPVLAIVYLCLTRWCTDEWPIFGAFIFLSFFTFPLFYPTTAFLAAACAGRLAYRWDRYRLSLSDRRRDLLLWRCLPTARDCQASFKAIPAQHRSSQ